MIAMKKDMTIKTYLDFVERVYGLSNDLHFSRRDLFTNIERFIMRALKGIRIRDNKKITLNLLIAFSWFGSLMNRLHIDIESGIWRRFPGKCSYCAAVPCACLEKKATRRRAFQSDERHRPKTLHEFQMLFENIYPANARTLEKAGIHLAEEIGELSEAFLAFIGSHEEKALANIELEAADLFSCFMGVFNSIDVDIASEIAAISNHNCHVCKAAPCHCSFKSIMNFKS